MGTSKINAGGNYVMDFKPCTQGEVEILLVASCYGNWDKLPPDRPLGSYADVNFTLPLKSQYSVQDMYV